MLVKDFQAKIASLPNDPADYQLYLAEPDTADGPTVDVELVPVDKISWDPSAQTLQLFPGESDSDEDSLFTAAKVVEEIPAEVDDSPDATLVVKLPIVRPETEKFDLSFGDVHEIVVGEKSAEIWLLVRPRSEYQDEDLPE
jgi:hypothetical protein